MPINKLRQNEESFNDLVDEVNSFIDDKKEFEFDKLKTPRARKKKRMADEMSEDETIVNSMKKFKIDTYITCIDMINLYLSEYFNMSCVGIFKDLYFALHCIALHYSIKDVY